MNRALAALGVDRDQVLRLEQPGGGRTHLPVGTPVTAGLLLTDFLELQDVATRSQMQTLAEHTECPWTRPQLQAYTADTAEAEERYQTEILGKRVSVLGLLERFRAVELPLAVFLDMMGPIRPRFYSISSAPLANPRHVRLPSACWKARPCPATASTGAPARPTSAALSPGTSSTATCACPPRPSPRRPTPPRR